MERALSWPLIKTEDVRALQDYSLFLRGCSNDMEGVEYLHELDLPVNMLAMIRKLPYKFRDKMFIHKLKQQLCFGMRGTSFATTVAPAENKNQHRTKEQLQAARRMCL